jgi:hypothetical protein
MYYLPWWMQWAQAIALIVISCLGSWIAYKQARIAAAKLNFDLYQKRFDVFEGARRLVTVTMQEGKVEVKEVLAFNLRVIDAQFLFESDVEQYLDKLRKQATAFYAKQQQLTAMADGDSRRNQLIDDIYSLEVSFSKESERMVDVFKPYLKLGNI